MMATVLENNRIAVRCFYDSAVVRYELDADGLHWFWIEAKEGRLCTERHGGPAAAWREAANFVGAGELPIKESLPPI